MEDKMRHQIILRWAAIALLLGPVHVGLYGQTLSPPATVNAQSGVRRQGFFDYVLDKINPQDKDYGAELERGRNAVVEHSIDDLYFWSNVVSLLLLTAAAGVIFLQWRAMDKRELIAATLIAQLWNGRVSDRIEIERRTEQFNQLVEVRNAEVERTLAAKSQPTDSSEHADAELKRTVEGLDKRQARAGATFDDGAMNHALSAASDNQDVQKTIAGLNERKTTLERQVEAFRNTEANLRKRLSDTMAQLEQERNRNRTLKGA
jgi:hypothetical protein